MVLASVLLRLLLNWQTWQDWGILVGAVMVIWRAADRCRPKVDPRAA